MRFSTRRADDRVVLEFLEESGRNVQRATLVLRDLVKDYPERSDLAEEMLLCEHEGDRITHDIIHALHAGGDGDGAASAPRTDTRWPAPWTTSWTSPSRPRTR
jgi:hypothetical protein